MHFVQGIILFCSCMSVVEVRRCGFTILYYYYYVAHMVSYNENVNYLNEKHFNLWVETARVVLQLVLKMYSNNIDGSKVGAFALHFLLLVLHPLSTFLKVNSVRK